MGLPEQNHGDELNRQLDYFCSIDPTTIRVAIDTSSSIVAGFMVFVAGEVHHLYVNVRYQRRGLGSRFLEEAKAQSPGGIELYTFQKNKKAQAFYQSHGFVEIDRGFAGLEDNPWASSTEELADIRYRWVASA